MGASKSPQRHRKRVEHAEALAAHKQKAVDAEAAAELKRRGETADGRRIQIGRRTLINASEEGPRGRRQLT